MHLEKWGLIQVCCKWTLGQDPLVLVFNMKADLLTSLEVHLSSPSAWNKCHDTVTKCQYRSHRGNPKNRWKAFSRTKKCRVQHCEQQLDCSFNFFLKTVGTFFPPPGDIRDKCEINFYKIVPSVFESNYRFSTPSKFVATFEKRCILTLAVILLLATLFCHWKQQHATLQSQDQK